MKYQLIHTFEESTFKIVCDSLHSCFEDSFLVEVELASIAEMVSVNHDLQFESGHYICSFELSLDLGRFGISNEDNFIEVFHETLSEAKGYIRLIKFQDEIRLGSYIQLYKEIADIEMSLREVFTYIFYYRYSPDYMDVFAEFDIKLNGDGGKPEVVIPRQENEFFYILFKDYKNLDLPRSPSLQDLIGAIRSEPEFESFRNSLINKGINKEDHKDFLESIKQTVVSIEEVRNCIAHNRAIPNRTLKSYNVAKPLLEAAISDFWSKVNLQDEADELWLWEEKAIEQLKTILQDAQWDEVAQTMLVPSLDGESGGKELVSYTELQAYLEEQALAAASAAFPSGSEERQLAEQQFNSGKVVSGVLSGFEANLYVMGWLQARTILEQAIVQ